MNDNAREGPSGGQADSRRSIGRSLIRGAAFGVLAALACFVLIALALLGLRSIQTLESAAVRIQAFTPYALALQCALVVVLWWRWADLVQCVIRRGWVSESGRELLMQRRNRWIGVMLLLEFFMYVATWPPLA